MPYSFHTNSSRTQPGWQSLSQSQAIGKTVFLSLSLLAGSGARATDIASETGRCVKAAASTTAILACERQARARWQAQIERHDRELLRRLADRDQRDYAAAQAAWKAFLAAEFALIDRTLGARPDALAKPLAEGAKVQLLRARGEQLATHLRAIQDSKTE